MKKELKNLLEKAISSASKANKWPASSADGPDFDMEQLSIEYTKDEKFGDYTSNIAMILAKKIGKKPMEIAEEIKAESEKLKDNNIEKIVIANPGYINFYLSPKYLQEVVFKINIEKQEFGNFKNKNEKVMVEFSQPNTHKEFHIGHLRNVFIGDAITKIIKKAGSDVIAANYIGDTGSHIAKCIWGILKFHGNENIDDVENKTEFLGKVYSESVRAISENPEFEVEFKELQKKFEEGDTKLVELWKKTKQWSLDEFQVMYDRLGTHFDVYFWESEEELAGKKMLPELLKVACIKESEGAIVADFEKEGLGVLVLVRKDGSALYGLKDIPLSVKKFKEFAIDRSIVVVDLRQSLYFKQIFKILEYMGFHKDMQHVGYEFVSLKGSETMSSRKGNIITATYLIDETIAKVKEKFPTTNIAEEISLGALKFYMLKYSSQTKIEYDIEESIKLNGATGPYVQYAHARICSILEKSQILNLKYKNNSNLELLAHEKELSLIKELDKFPQLVEEIAESYEVHKLAHYAIKLADKFHSFYDVCKVNDHENEELSSARLSLVNAVRIVLAETLNLVGVSAPDKM